MKNALVNRPRPKRMPIVNCALAITPIANASKAQATNQGEQEQAEGVIADPGEFTEQNGHDQGINKYPSPIPSGKISDVARHPIINSRKASK